MRFSAPHPAGSGFLGYIDVLPIFNTASLVGFGAVIAALPVFQTISQAALAIGGSDPLVSVAGSGAILSAMTVSASGGMSIALDALGSTFVDMAHSTGVSLEAMHRVTAIASGVLDTLPHSGAIITRLGELVWLVLKGVDGQRVVSASFMT